MTLSGFSTIMKKTLLIIACIGFFCLYIANSGGLDYRLSLLPYDVVTNKFYGETHLWVQIIYYLIPVIVTLIIIFCLFILCFTRKLKFAPQKSRRFALIILISLAIGPGLIVNPILKDNWGRPRPYQVLRDHEEFRPMYRPNFGESHDNSFPCGHATIGFFLGVPFLACGRRRRGLIVSIVGGSLVGFIRILQGGHYL